MKFTRSTTAVIIALLLLSTCCFISGYVSKGLQQDKATICPYEGLECPDTLCREHHSPLSVKGDYQLDVYEDSTVIWDANRHVATLRYDSTQALDKVISADNE